ncbi:MAG: hypothetical protein M1828_007010 [Chrysothrix sp. TS-e1954]|nr:MAG: hypothetical protein M1828_007010 [Chrysothrix sp. TS-e1954]
MDKILQASRQKCELAHRWIGRVVVLHGGLHGAICLYLRASTRRVGTPMLVLLIAILIHSLLLIRRRLYELFLKLHLLGAIGLLAMLWAHIELRRGLAAACLLTSSLLWALQTLWWLAYLIYQNSGSGRSVLSIVGFDEEYTERQHAVQVWISLKHPWKVLPGQYIYLTIPRYARQDFGLPQAHPYLILWDEDEDNAVGGCRKIVLLIASARGFSNNIRFGRQGGSTVLLDGPYGHSHDFTSYDTVFFMASGVGIAAHLLHMRRLLRAYYDRTCRIRRISLVWLVEEHGQEQWAIGILRQMLETDKSRVMTVVLYVPHEVARSRPSKDVEGVNLYREESALDIPWYIRKEQLCESGTMALSGKTPAESSLSRWVCTDCVEIVCGRPPFERRIRAAACEISGIDLFTSAYLPDGDERDESWQNRCTAPPEEPGKRLQKAHLSVIPR